MKKLLNRTIPRRWIRRILVGLALACAAAAGLSVAGVALLSRDLPSLESLQSISPARKTLIFAATGDTLQEFYTQNRVLVPLDRIPRRLQEAVIATEDRRFYRHYGIDLRRLVRIVWDNLSGQGRPGASTLTMQLARNLFPRLLPSEKLITRKLREMIVAVQIEQIYTKDEILAMYLNQIYLGRGTYGMQAAAHAFFDRNVWELSDAEATLLAGVIQLPERYSPVNHLDRAYRRRAIVLDSMVQAGYLRRAEAESIGAAEVTVVADSVTTREAGFAAYFVEEVRKELERRFGAERLYSDGLRVWTTLVPRYQRWMEEALEDHLAAVEVERGYAMTRAVHDSLVAAGTPPATIEYLQGAALLEDVRTGAILAMVGGRSFADSKWNNATQALRQPGSVFKPVVYLTALEHGYHAASILMDTPFVVDTGVSLWRPKNFSGQFEGPVTLRYALSHSVNLPTAKFYNDFGLQPLVENAHRLGIKSDLPAVPSLFLGAGEVTLEEVVGAYAVFANHGVWVRPHLVTHVETLGGEVLHEARIEQREALDPALAYLMTDLMHTTLREGTGQSARWLGFTKTGAGKTGTTNDNTNAWFCGFTPSFCGGVWVGFDTAVTMKARATGARMALPIWARFMGRIADERGDEPFVRPPGIVEKQVCLRSGQLATSDCDSTATEVFLPDVFPTRLCDLHGGELLEMSGFKRGFESLDESRRDSGEF